MFTNSDNFFAAGLLCFLLPVYSFNLSAAELKAMSSAQPTPRQSSSGSDTDTTLKKNTLIRPVGRVINLKGTVNSLKENKFVHHLKEHSLLYLSDVIYTEEKSTVGLRLNDGSFIVLGPDSVLEIKKYRLTSPPKGQAYTGAFGDHAEILLLKGNLKATFGSLVTANQPSFFSILTPRGRLMMTSPKNPNLEMLYNNKVGLVAMAEGLLSTDKGQVTLTQGLYGLVSAILGSSPTTTLIKPMCMDDPNLVSTSTFFKSTRGSVDTTYSELFMSEEDHELTRDGGDTAEESIATAYPNEVAEVSEDFTDALGDDDDESNAEEATSDDRSSASSG